MHTLTPLLPIHNRLACSRCFPSGAEWGVSSIERDGWVLENNPMAWGSRDPRYLVLGFSKGTRQCSKLLTTHHDDVPFAGFRNNVTEILKTLGLLVADEKIDHRINEAEIDFAFGSLIRCSVAHVDPVTSIPSKSGDIIGRLARRGDGEDWAMNCVRQFLAALPPRLKVVVLLSNDFDYIEACFERLRSLYPSLRRINEVAYGDGGVTWVHTVHGSPLAQSHINAWLEGANTTQGRKQRLAVEALQHALSVSGARLVEVEQPAVKSAMNAFSPHTTASERIERDRMTESGRPIPQNPMREAIHDALRRHPALHPHPAQERETKYISAFATTNGRALALDKMSAGKQPIWIEADAVPSDSLMDVERDFYPPTRGRNSNLHKLPGFKDGALIRFYPETVEDVLRIVDLILRR